MIEYIAEYFCCASKINFSNLFKFLKNPFNPRDCGGQSPNIGVVWLPKGERKWGAERKKLAQNRACTSLLEVQPVLEIIKWTDHRKWLEKRMFGGVMAKKEGK